MSQRHPTFPSLVQDFFERYLVAERQLRPNTVLAYRDAIKLYLRFAAQARKRSPDRLEVESALDPELVRGFLAWLERERSCGPRSRNHRLSVLKTFARYVAGVAPEHLDRCQRVRSLPPARFDQPEVQYLEKHEVRALLSAPGDDSFGLRDHALLLLLYNTGARVQELVDLRVADLRLEAMPRARLRGKGGKERTCPLWARTARALERWLSCCPNHEAESPIFINTRGERLSRSGVAYLLRRAAQRASLGTLANARSLTPHVFRHTAATHLLEAGVDLTVIASWLGHAQISTTHAYVVLTNRMKLKAVLAAARTIPELVESRRRRPEVMAWLEAIRYRPRYVESRRPRRARTGSVARGSQAREANST